MQLKITLAAAAMALGGLVAAAPANASSADVTLTIQVGDSGHRSHDRDWRDHEWRHHDYLSTREVRRILRHRGFHEVRFVDSSGSIYRAYAEDYRGRDVLVTVSARSGAILDVDRIGRHHRRHH
jgi:hypothetical protein